MKKKIMSMLGLAYFGFAFMLLFGVNAQAYIDPSVVTYIIQAVAGVVIALGAVFTVYRHKIVKFFRNQKKKQARKKHQSEEKDQSEDKQ